MSMIHRSETPYSIQSEKETYIDVDKRKDQKKS